MRRAVTRTPPKLASKPQAMNVNQMELDTGGRPILSATKIETSTKTKKTKKTKKDKNIEHAKQN